MSLLPQSKAVRSASLCSATRTRSVYRRAKASLDEVLKAPDRWTYTDLAIAPQQPEEFETLDLYHATSGGKAALARKHLNDRLRAKVHATAFEPAAPK